MCKYQRTEPNAEALFNTFRARIKPSLSTQTMLTILKHIFGSIHASDKPVRVLRKRLYHYVTRFRAIVNKK